MHRRQELDALRQRRAGSVRCIIQWLESLDGKGRHAPWTAKTDGHYTDHAQSESTHQFDSKTEPEPTWKEGTAANEKSDILTNKAEVFADFNKQLQSDAVSGARKAARCVERYCLDDEELSSALSLITPILESESMQDTHDAKVLSPAAQDWYRDWLSPKSSGRLKKKSRESFDTLLIERTPFSPPQARFDALAITDRIESTISTYDCTELDDQEDGLSSAGMYSGLPRLETLSDSELSSDWG